MTDTYKMKTPLVTLETAGDQARAALEAARAQVGFVPNMYGAMANSPGLLETYLFGYDRLRKGSALTPPEQEVVFLTISRANGCDYCMAAHSMIGEKMSKVPADVLKAVRVDAPIDDARLAALSVFTEAMFVSRGRPSDAVVEAFKTAGYDERHMLDVVLALAVKTLSNYANHLFHTPVDPAFDAWRWTAPAA
ncbi:carboxymuconolactone decarboxylase family protein [Brevundimonas sp.]|uniref:carboxymuconolactone decarboxylase family protein n=1 Tax=Brevundimonas sp. TaxID=1871086 RepID=UPI003F6E665A